jgi:hypothetical protein
VRRLLDLVNKPSRTWRIVGWCVLIIGSCAAGWFGVPAWWVVVPVLVVTMAPLIADGATDVIAWRAARRRAWHARALAEWRVIHEPIDAWVIELDGEDIGHMFGLEITDMFWKTYVVLGDHDDLYDEALWLSCRFRYRHALSARYVDGAFCGGMRPTRDEPFVSMRCLR